VQMHVPMAAAMPFQKPVPPMSPAYSCFPMHNQGLPRLIEIPKLWL
jgi:hypothetical protein